MTTYIDELMVEQVITRMEEAFTRMIVNLDAAFDRVFKRALVEFKTIKPELKSSEELHDPEIEAEIEKAKVEAEIENAEIYEAEVETEIGAQAIMELETKDFMMKYQAQVKETTKFEDGNLQATLGVTIQIWWNNKLAKPMDMR